MKFLDLIFIYVKAPAFSFIHLAQIIAEEVASFSPPLSDGAISTCIMKRYQVSWIILQLLLHSYKWCKKVQKCRETGPWSHSGAKPKWKTCRCLSHGSWSGIKWSLGFHSQAFVFWSTLRHLSSFFFHHMNLYFRWPKAPLFFVNKQNPTCENKSSDDETVGFKETSLLQSEVKSSGLLSIRSKN